MPPGEIAASDIEDFSLSHQLFHRLPDLFPGCVTVDVVHLVKVDMVGLQTPEARFTGFANVVGGQTPVIDLIAHLAIDLGGENDAITVLRVL